MPCNTNRLLLEVEEWIFANKVAILLLKLAKDNSIGVFQNNICANRVLKRFHILFWTNNVSCLMFNDTKWEKKTCAIITVVRGCFKGSDTNTFYLGNL